MQKVDFNKIFNEQEFKNLVLEIVAERFTFGDNTNQEGNREENDGGERGSIHERGKVKDPEHDKRLKQNRNDVA